jgi:EAL domain-containing protein (putative c-di-GMP-specific phosphodiesterase class I)
MVTTAEGVETEEQLALVRLAGCNQVQGFLFGRPGPAAQFDWGPAARAAVPLRS